MGLISTLRVSPSLAVMVAEVLPGAKVQRGLGTVASTVRLSGGVSVNGSLYGTMYGTVYGTVYSSFANRLFGRYAVFPWGRREAVYGAVYGSR